MLALKKAAALALVIFLFLFAAFHLYCFTYQDAQFKGKKLSANYHFQFKRPFTELTFRAPDGAKISAVHFRQKKTKGLIFFLHGNKRNIASHEKIYNQFLEQGYDVITLDYRDYGKSTGSKSQQAFYFDAQMVYNECRQLYPENKITVFGHSLGCTMAAYLAAKNHPKALIAIAPLYSLADFKKNFPWYYPKYSRFSFTTDEFIKNLQCPAYLFCGTKDKFYDAAKRLCQLSAKAHFLSIYNSGHDGIFNNIAYRQQLKAILN